MLVMSVVRLLCPSCFIVCFMCWVVVFVCCCVTLRLSKSRVPLLLIVLVARGFADSVCMCMSCSQVFLSLWTFWISILCVLGDRLVHVVVSTLCGLGYRFIRLSIVHTYMRFWLLCSCSFVSDVSYLAPVLSGLGNRTRYFSAQTDFEHFWAQGLTFSEWVFWGCSCRVWHFRPWVRSCCGGPARGGNRTRDNTA